MALLPDWFNLKFQSRFSHAADLQAEEQKLFGCSLPRISKDSLFILDSDLY